MFFEILMSLIIIVILLLNYLIIYQISFFMILSTLIYFISKNALNFE